MDDCAFLLDCTRKSWRALGAPKRIMAAVSGGADSVALLLVLKALAQEEHLMLLVSHVDHGLRPDSHQDAAYVASLCDQWGIFCRVLPVQVDGTGENAAREARYQALMRQCALDDVQALALAHHQRDQAETMLLHLFRGSGGTGLAGMEACRKVSHPDGKEMMLWRPFLEIPPELLRNLLMQKGISWREDSTNGEDHYLRNYMRHAVLPAINARIPRAEEAMGRAARVLRQEADYFRQEAEHFLINNACLTSPCRFVQRGPLDQVHPALRRHILRMACPVSLDGVQTERLMDIHQGQTINLPENWRAFCTANRLHFLPPEKPEPCPGRLVQATLSGTGDGIRCQMIPKELLPHCQLRFRQAGDRIHPLGAPGEKSLQDYWVDKKVDRPFRDYMPLLCLENRVIWSIGVGPGEEARITENNDGVYLQYEGFLPGEIPAENDNQRRNENG